MAIYTLGQGLQHQCKRIFFHFKIYCILLSAENFEDVATLPRPRLVASRMFLCLILVFGIQFIFYVFCVYCLEYMTTPF